MKTKHLAIILLIISVFSCKKKEDLSPNIVLLNSLSETLSVGDTLKLQFYVQTFDDIQLIEIYCGDSILSSKTQDFLSANTDSIFFNYVIPVSDFGKILEFDVFAADIQYRASIKRYPVSIDNTVTPNYLILKIEDEYSNASSYQDTGVMITRIVSENPNSMEFNFSTAFQRTGLYRFEYIEKNNSKNRYIIHRNASGAVNRWWGSTGKVESQTSLSMAIASATGVSSGLAVAIPSFLIPEEITVLNLLRRLENIELNGTETINAADCYVLAGTMKNYGYPHTFYVEKQNFLIRRIQIIYQLPEYKIESTTDYSPLINITIPAKKFEFNYPEN